MKSSLFSSDVIKIINIDYGIDKQRKSIKEKKIEQIWQQV